MTTINATVAAQEIEKLIARINGLTEWGAYSHMEVTPMHITRGKARLEAAHLNSDNGRFDLAIRQVGRANEILDAGDVA